MSESLIHLAEGEPFLTPASPQRVLSTTFLISQNNKRESSRVTQRNSALLGTDSTRRRIRGDLHRRLGPLSSHLYAFQDMRLPRIIHRWSLRLSFPLLAFFLLSSVILLHNSSRLSAKNLRKKVVFNSFPASFRDLRHHLRLYGEDSDADILDVEVYGQDPADHELPGLHVADRSAQRHHRGPDRDGKRRLAEHKLRDDGLLQVNPEGRHPIHDLIEDAKERWQSKIEKQSLTILEAVREYKRRYNRDPPLGFDHW